MKVLTNPRTQGYMNAGSIQSYKLSAQMSLKLLQKCSYLYNVCILELFSDLKDNTCITGVKRNATLLRGPTRFICY